MSTTASAIEWTDATWNPVVGCKMVSPGCANCYAETMSNRLAGMAAAEDVGAKPTRKDHYLKVIDPYKGLNHVTPDDVRREGFPGMTPAEFVAMFCEHMGGDGGQAVTRIEFRRVEVPNA